MNLKKLDPCIAEQFQKIDLDHKFGNGSGGRLGDPVGGLHDGEYRSRVAVGDF